MKAAIRNLIPSLHQEFVLVVFLLLPYIFLQFSLSPNDVLLLSSATVLLMIIWFAKVFFQVKASSQYKGFIVLVIGLSLFIAGLYASIVYYVETISVLSSSFFSFLYLFFPIWVMLEGIFLLFLLGFDSSQQLRVLEKKIVIKKPLLGDFFMVALATVFLVILGDWVLDLSWYMNVCLVLAVNLILINQFSE